MRNWLWDTFGPSNELWLIRREIQETNVDPRPWAWDNDRYVCRLYLCSDKEYATFLLKWGN